MKLQFILLDDLFASVKSWDATTVFLVVVIGVLMVYVIASVRNGKQVFVSQKMDGTEKIPTKADQYYYLPAAALTVEATAHVLITKSPADDSVLDAKLLDIALKNTVTIVPDSDHLILIQYKGFVFANDELRVATNANSLLENVSAISEDRISNIIQQISDTPKNLLTARYSVPTALSESVLSDDSRVVTQVAEYRNIFYILPEELTQERFDREWTIEIAGLTTGANKEVDASIQWKIGKALAPHEWDGKPILGLLTRPLRTLQLDVHRKSGGASVFDKKKAFSEQILVPDVERLIQVPVRRYPFVKGQYLPKFSTGLLVENYINKPSEFEGFLSIPINILKAVFSIPAQLFNQKITHIQPKTELEKSLQGLANARAAGKQPNPQQGMSPDDVLSLLNKAQQLDRKPDAPSGSWPKLGKAAPDTNISIRAMIDAELEFDQNFPPTVPEKDWSEGMEEGMDWLSYRNDNRPGSLNDCVPAAAAHLIMAWTFNAFNVVKKIDETSLVGFFNILPKDQNGFVSIRNLAERWKAVGIAGDKIDSFYPFTASDTEKVKTAINLFGGCIIGLQLPNAVKDMSIEWKIPEGGDTAGDWARSGWGGHAVAVIGYTANSFTCISWGKKIVMDENFYEAYNDEAWAILSKNDWLKNDKSPGDLSYVELSQHLNQLAFQTS